MFSDVNSLYAKVMSGKLPFGNFHEMNENEIENFNIEDVDLNGEYCYALLIDYEIPDECKIKSDDLPMGIHQEEVTFDDLSEFTKELVKETDYKFTKQKTLVASHKSREKYLISLNLLRIFTGLGLECKKIHRIFRFGQTEIFKDFINKKY